MMSIEYVCFSLLITSLQFSTIWREKWGKERGKKERERNVMTNREKRGKKNTIWSGHWRARSTDRSARRRFRWLIIPGEGGKGKEKKKKVREGGGRREKREKS